MSKRRGTQHHRRRTSAGRAAPPGATPEGFVVMTDSDGIDHLVYAPELRQEMRHNCPICRGDE